MEALFANNRSIRIGMKELFANNRSIRIGMKELFANNRSIRIGMKELFANNRSIRIGMKELFANNRSIRIGMKELFANNRSIRIGMKALFANNGHFPFLVACLLTCISEIRRYFPMQKWLKMFWSTSLGVICPWPVMAARSDRTRRRDSAMRSPESWRSRPLMTSCKSVWARSKAS